MANIFLVIIIFFFFILPTSSQTHHSRRILHQRPVFPLESLPPIAQPSYPSSSFSPSPQPQPQFQQPKYPFSSLTPPNTPFFPFYPSPPPPPPATTAVATFPANISSLILPQTSSSSSKPFSHKLVTVIITLSLLLSAIFITSLITFYFLKRRRFVDHHKPSRQDSVRLFPPNTTTSDAVPKTPPAYRNTSSTSSEFLYLGTLVNPREVDENNGDKTANPNNATAASAYERLGSPELHPLPPLPRNNVRQKDPEDDQEDNDDEEFFSPRGSSAGGKGSPENSIPTSHRVFENENFRSRSFNAFPHSNPVSASHSVSSSPSINLNFSPGSLISKSPDSVVIFPAPPRPIPPPPPRERRPPTPSSPPERTSGDTLNSPSRISDVAVQNLHSGSHVNRVSFQGQCVPINFPLQPGRSSVETLTSSSARIPNFSGQDLQAGFSVNVQGQNGPPSSRGRNLDDTHNSSPVIQDFTGPPVNVKFVDGQDCPMKFPPPPPPPPLPPPRFWETPVGVTGPPVLVAPSRPIVFQNTVSIPAGVQVKTVETVEANEEISKPKLKPLHWDKVRASSDRAMVWDQLKSSSFQLNEEMIETLFTVNSSMLAAKDGHRRHVMASVSQENRVLDPKKSQNISILLRALNVTIDEVCEALLEGNADTLGTELLESLLKMAPTKEEERKLKEFKDESPLKLGSAEKFLRAVLDIPFAFKRVGAMLYIANFDSEVEYLKRSFETLEAACGELRNSRMFTRLLEAVLKTGNRMNIGTNRGDAHAFKLDTLLKLVDVKGTDGKTTLLHFVVQEIIRAEGSRLSGMDQNPAAENNQQSDFRDDLEFRKVGLQVVSGLSGELTNVKKAASMDSDVLDTDVTKLATGIGKIDEVLKLNEELTLEGGGKFTDSISGFLKKANKEIVKIQAQKAVAMSTVKEITEYFHGNSAKEEAHPFRIFMVVRDFLSILDHVCKEVGKINGRTIVSSGRQYSHNVNSSIPPVFPGFTGRHHSSSSDDEKESSFSA